MSLNKNHVGMRIRYKNWNSNEYALIKFIDEDASRISLEYFLHSRTGKYIYGLYEFDNFYNKGWSFLQSDLIKKRLGVI